MIDGDGDGRRWGPSIGERSDIKIQSSFLYFVTVGMVAFFFFLSCDFKKLVLTLTRHYAMI